MEDTVNIAKSQLDELLAQNKELLDQNRSLMSAATREDDTKGTLKPDEVKENTVRILFVDGKAVQGFHNRGTDTRPSFVYEKPDPQNPKEVILYVDVIFNGEEEPVAVPYNELLRDSLREECKIKKTDVKPWDIVQGKTTQKVVKDYATEETGILIPIKVVGETRVFTVALPDGKEMEIHENFVNM